MVTPQLLDYIKQQTAAGIAKADIEKALVAGGWNLADVGEAFAALAPKPVVPPPMPAAPMAAKPASVMEQPAVTIAPMVAAAAPKKSNGLLIALIIILLLILAAGAAIIFVPSLNKMVMNVLVPTPTAPVMPYTPPPAAVATPSAQTATSTASTTAPTSTTTTSASSTTHIGL